MIEWNIFYKLLDIPENVTEPTYYDLLGMHPKNCNAELVDIMLQKRRSRLRQNIPGPQFIPLVLKFEQKKLEKAATVLRNPALREKYNRYLRQKVLERKSEKQKEGTRRDLLQKARHIVNSLLNNDKTLDEQNRPILAEKLRDLGIKESKINSLLERIPRPATKAAMPGNESMEYFITAVDLAISGNFLIPETELKIMELAKKLGIEQEQARNKIDQKLKEKNARRGNVVAGHEPDESEKKLVAYLHSHSRRNIIPVAVIVTTVSVFILSVLFFLMNRKTIFHEPESLTPETSSNNTQIPPRPDQEPNVPGPPAIQGDLDSVESAKTRSSQDVNNISGIINSIAEFAIPSRPAPSRSVQRKLTLKARDIRKFYSKSTGKEEISKNPELKEDLLADLAVTMRVCYHRAMQFTPGDTVAFSESSKLNQQLKMSSSDRVEYMIAKVDLIPMPPAATLADSYSFVPKERKTAEELLSNIKERINRIKRMRRNTRQSMMFVNRDIYQLSKMSDPGIPQRLKALIPTNIKLIDLTITRTLDKISGSVPSTISGGGRGGPGYSFSRRISPGRLTQQPARTPTSEPTVERDPNSIKLLAFTAHYAGLTAKQLRQDRGFSRNSRTRYSQAANGPEIYCSASDVGKKLLDELDTIAEQLIFFTAVHPDKQYSKKTQAVAKRMVDRKLACTTVLQKAVVSLDATAETLELLVQQLEPSDELKNDFAQARRQREQSRLKIDNVLHELRESCYYNLSLWDMLVEYNDGKIPVSPEDGGWPSNPDELPSIRDLATSSEQPAQKQNDALNDLRKGLNAYINGDYAAAKQGLNNAQQSQYVKTWADSELLTSLEDIRNRCEKALKDMSECRNCDGSGLVACDTCFGSGWIRCPQCWRQGTTLSGRGTYSCSNCQGERYVICVKCKGEPFDECKTCTAEAGIGSNERKTIEDVIAKAVYLSNGGIDLFTPQAFEPSPGIRIQP